SLVYFYYPVLHHPPLLVYSLSLPCLCLFSFIFFFNAPATTDIYTLSLHDALPIYLLPHSFKPPVESPIMSQISSGSVWASKPPRDRKSTRLNSSHGSISYAVFCLKKKNITKKEDKNKITHRQHHTEYIKHHTTKND